MYRVYTVCKVNAMCRLTTKCRVKSISSFEKADLRLKKMITDLSINFTVLKPKPCSN